MQPKTYTQKPQAQNVPQQNAATSATADLAQSPYVPDAYLGIGSSMNDDDDLPF